MMKDYYRYSVQIKKLTITQQKVLCTLVYFGKYYYSHISQEKLLKWINSDRQDYMTMFNELFTKGWLVEELPHHGTQIGIPCLHIFYDKILFENFDV